MAFVAGQKIRASDLNDVLPLWGRVTTDQTKTSSTVLGNVTGLSAAVLANATYVMDCYLPYTAGATGDLKVAITVPTGLTGHWGLYCLATGGTGVAGDLDGRRIDAFGDASIQVAGGADTLGGALLCVPHGYLVVAGTAGTVQFRFAQNASSGTSTVIKSGAWMRLMRVA